MAAFIEWYVAERPLSATGTPPALARLDPAASPALTSEERAALGAILASHRSVFEVTAVTTDTVDLCDLVAGARFVVREQRSTAGFRAGDLLEARLFWTGGRWFGKTFLFHPRDARDVVLDWVERTAAGGASRAEMLFHLSRLYVRWHRLGHANAAKVYRDG